MINNYFVVISIVYEYIVFIIIIIIIIITITITIITPSLFLLYIYIVWWPFYSNCSEKNIRTSLLVAHTRGDFTLWGGVVCYLWNCHTGGRASELWSPLSPYRTPSGKSTVGPWKSPIFSGFIHLPTPVTARVCVNLLEAFVVINSKKMVINCFS